MQRTAEEAAARARARQMLKRLAAHTAAHDVGAHDEPYANVLLSAEDKKEARKQRYG